MFVYNFYCGVNFCGRNFCWRFFSLELSFADPEKPAEIGTRKNLVPHGSLFTHDFNLFLMQEPREALCTTWRKADR